MWLSVCALIRQAAAPLKSSPGSGSPGPQEQRGVVSLHLYSGGMVSYWGKIRLPRTELLSLKKNAEQRKLCLLMPAAVRARHQSNPSHVLSTQQDGSLGGLIPAATSLIPTLLGAPPDGGGSSSPPQPHCTESHQPYPTLLDASW